MAMAIAPSSTFKPKRYMANNFFIVHCRLVASVNYPNPGGDVLDFKPLSRYNTKQPLLVFIVGIAGFKYEYDLANKKVKVRINDAGGANAPQAEVANGAYPAGVTGDTIDAFVVFGGMV